MAGDPVLCPHCSGDMVYTRHAGRMFDAYLGNALHVLRDLPPGSVDMVLTDPPYGTGANGVAGRLRSTTAKYTSRTTSLLPDFHGDSVMPDIWQRLIFSVYKKCFRLLKPGGYALVFSDWRAVSQMISLLGVSGFSLSTVCVWDKGRRSRPTKNGFRAQSELIVCAKKSGVMHRDTPVYLDGVFRCNAVPGASRVHLVEKPVELLSQLIEACPPGGTVLDPFHGSGSTGVAALKSGRRYIGAESVEHYHHVAVERLSAMEQEIAA